jgi:ketosteroid isomerase-like protein
MLKCVANYARPAIGLIAAGLLLGVGGASSGICSAQQPGMPRAEKHESKHEIDQLEEAWREAALKSNITAMDALLADDYMGITASGMLQTKEQTLAHLHAGQTHFTSLDLFERKVRFYGTTAVVTSIAKVNGVTPEGDLSGSYRYTRVYVRDTQGKWKIVSFEASPIRNTEEHHKAGNLPRKPTS